MMHPRIKLTNVRSGRADVVDRVTGWPLGEVKRSDGMWLGAIDGRWMIAASTRRDAAWQVADINPAITLDT